MHFPTTTFFVSLFSILSSFSVLARPISSLQTLEARDVFVPPILKPDSSSVWVVGSTFTVTWNTTDHPVNITNSKGQIVLGKAGLIFVNETGGLNDPLAKGFDILSGSQDVTVPDVQDGVDYFIVLFGDSGNFSQNFTITHTNPDVTLGPGPADIPPSTGNLGGGSGMTAAIDDAHDLLG